MGALLLGLVAAVAWGVHDVCVRYVSQRTSLVPALAVVLFAGTIVILPVAAVLGGWARMTPDAWMLSAASGAAFVLGGFGLYKAFSLGPVSLVSPIVAAYPVLSVGWAAISDRYVGVAEWLAILAIIAGVAVVAALCEPDGVAYHRRKAICWAMASGLGYALTFAFGQAATRVGAELPVIIATRVAAMAVLMLPMMLRAEGLWLRRTQMPLLAAMGLLDAVALSAVIAAGTLPNPEYASVTSSAFGLVTILLAWIFLREPMRRTQWGGVCLAFAGVVYLAS